MNGLGIAALLATLTAAALTVLNSGCGPAPTSGNPLPVMAQTSSKSAPASSSSSSASSESQAENIDAAPEVSENGPALTLAQEPPNGGAIDRYHTTQLVIDRNAYALYALRNTAIEDLLATRISLMLLIGGNPRGREVPGKRDIFALPAGVVDLYSGRGALPGLAERIEWLRQNKPAYNAELRARLRRGLAFYSAQLANYDQQLKFYREDFWRHRSIESEFYDAEVRAMDRLSQRNMRFLPAAAAGMAGSISASSSAKLVEEARQRWMTRHGMTDVITEREDSRARILASYRLLSFEIDGKPLYKLIYDAMEPMGFPRASMVQTPVETRLPRGTDVIPPPRQFEQALGQALDELAGPRMEELSERLGQQVDARIDDALLLALEANTSRLEDLTRNVTYDARFSHDSPLLELAGNPAYWDAMLARYGYLGRSIDFASARKELVAEYERVAKVRRNLRYVGYGAVIGAGVVAAVIPFVGAAEAGAAGTVSAWLGLSRASWTIGAGAVGVAASGGLYYDSRRAAQLARNRYLSSPKAGSYNEMKDAIEMKEADFNLLLGAALFLGWESRFAALAVARPVAKVGGETMVRIARSQWDPIVNDVSALARRARLVPMGRTLITHVRDLMARAVGLDEVMDLNQALPIVAQQLKSTPGAVMAALEKAPGIGGLIRGCRARNETALLIGRPSFWKQMATQQGVNAGVEVIAYAYERGEKIWGSESGDFVRDMIFGTFLTFSVVYSESPASVAAFQAAQNASGKASFRVNALKHGKAVGMNFMTGLFLSGLTNVLTHTAQFSKNLGNPDAPTAGERLKEGLLNTLYSASFLGLHSYGRYALYTHLSEKIARKVSNPQKAKILIQSYNWANQGFGAWHYVRLAKDLGVMEDKEDPNQGKLFRSFLDFVGSHADERGGIYIKLDPPAGQSADEASYLFDFLNAGGAPLPAAL